jgi:hypothetical protein
VSATPPTDLPLPCGDGRAPANSALTLPSQTATVLSHNRDVNARHASTLMRFATEIMPAIRDSEIGT